MEDEDKKQKIYKMIMVVVLTATITFLLTVVYLYNYIEVDNQVVIFGSKEDVTLDDKKEAIKELLNRYFLGEIKDEKLETGQLKGLVAILDDPYTQYLTKEEWDDFQADSLGRYAGIGIRMIEDKQNNEILITEPIPNTPAERARNSNR